MNCGSIQSLVVDEFFPTQVIAPLLNSHVGSSLKSLEIGIPFADDLEGWGRVLPLLKVLQHLHLKRRLDYAESEAVPGDVFENFISTLPSTLTCLTIDEMDGKTEGMHFAKRMIENHLPALQELTLACLRLENVAQADYFNMALRSKTGGNLCSLHLYIELPEQLIYDDGIPRCLVWELTSRVLGLHLPYPQFDVLPRAQSILLGRPDWDHLGASLLEGRFPALMKVEGTAQDFVVYPHYRIDEEEVLPKWYELEERTLGIWLELIKRRKIQLGDDIRFLSSTERAPRLPRLFDTLFRGLLHQSIESTTTSCVTSLDIDRVPLDCVTSNTLAEAIRSNLFRNATSLKLRFGGACGRAIFTNLGQVVHNGFLPSLTSLSLAVNVIEADPPHLERWQAFFGAIPRTHGGLDTVKSLATVMPLGSYTSPVFHALAKMGGPALFQNLKRMTLLGPVMGQDLGGICTSFMAGCFPSLNSFCFEDCTILALKDDPGALLLFLYTLCHFTKIQKLHLGMYARYMQKPVYVGMLEMLETFFSQSPENMSSLKKIGYPGGPSECWDDTLKFEAAIKALRFGQLEVERVYIDGIMYHPVG